MDETSKRNFRALNEEAKRVDRELQSDRTRIIKLEQEIMNLRGEIQALKNIVAAGIGRGSTSG